MDRQDEALMNNLAEAIMGIRIPDAPTIRQAAVEPYLASDGEAALKAVIIADAPDENGWSAEFTHALRRQVNTLAVEHHFAERVYVTLFTQEDVSELAKDNRWPGCPAPDRDDPGPGWRRSAQLDNPLNMPGS
ncbi:hypothetical protein GCM10009850_102020 [Nonomuraea monospora]|uniref:Uncharacterized protein n=2 Tax=Nonomuraea monospora TaxID=568818 RepID=A0ABP5PWL3_9ACTN